MCDRRTSMCGKWSRRRLRKPFGFMAFTWSRQEASIPMIPSTSLEGEQAARSEIIGWPDTSTERASLLVGRSPGAQLRREAVNGSNVLIVGVAYKA